jgi:hypothetical protein
MDDKNAKLPSVTATQVRVQIFEPTRRPKSKRDDVRIVETSWGKAKITGTLAQPHADVLEAILFHATDWKRVGDTVIATVDPHKIRNSADQHSGSNLEKVLTDIMQAVIDVRTNDGIFCKGHIIDHIDRSEELKVNPLGGMRPMWQVTIGKAYFQMLIEDKAEQRRDPFLISRITTGVAQAVTRLCLSHKNTPNGGWILDNLIKEVGAGSGGNQLIRDRRREIRNDVDAMAKSGVLVEGDRVHLKKDHK